MPLLVAVQAPSTVDLRLKIVPVAQAVAALAQKGGLKLETDKRVAERKITVLLHGADPKEAMARIADVMRLTWDTKNGVSRLVPEVGKENRERAHVAAERAARQGDLRNWIARLAEGKLTSPESPFQSRAVTALAALDENGRRRLLAGEPMLFDSKPNPAAILLPGTALEPNEYFQPTPLRRLAIFARLSDDGTALRLARFEEEAQGGLRRGGGDVLPQTDPGRLPLRTKLAEELAAWSQSTLVGPEALRRTDPRTPERPSEWNGGALTDSDRLEWLYDAAGIDVVARADRRVAPFAKLRFDGTVADFVAAWRGRSPLGKKDFFRLDHGTLMERPAGWWDRATEPSESVLRPFEKIEKPSLDDWLLFVSKLSDPQAKDLAGGNVVARRPMRALVSAPGLRFWAVLRPDQRAKALKGFVEGAELTPAQRDALVRTALDGATGPDLSPDLLEALLADDPAAFRFSAAGSASGTNPDGTTFRQTLLGFGRGRDGMQFTFPAEP